MTLTVGSLFSGIGGIELGFERVGMKCIWQVENNQHARTVLQRHWPDVARHGDVREVGERNLETVDLISAGFPCQDLSVAGHRAGLGGSRSGLFWEVVRIARELSPRWLLLENVPGLLSSWSTVEPPPDAVEGGEWEVEETSDFESVLSALVGLGYGVAWRILDAQYAGVPQRRERVFIVGCLGDPIRAAQVLFERESCKRNTPPSRKAGAEVAGRLGGGTTGRGWNDDLDRSGAFIPETSHCLKAEGSDASEDGTGRGIPIVAATLRSRQAASEGVNQPGRGGEDDANLIVFSELGEGHQTYQKTDVAMSLRTSAGGGGLMANLAVTPIDMRQASRGEKVTNNRATGSGGPPGVGVGKEGDPSFTVSERGQVVAIDVFNQSGASHAVAFNIVGMAQQGKNHAYETEVAGCLQHKGLAVTGNEAGTVIAFKESQSGCSLDGVNATLDANKGSRRQEGIVSGMMVRRLTPLECTRLQGFPEMEVLAIIRICLDHQKSGVLAETKSLRWQKSVLPVTARQAFGRWRKSVESAASLLLPSDLNGSGRAALTVRTSCGAGSLELRSEKGELLFSVANVGSNASSLALGFAVDFARLLALTNLILDRTTQTGEGIPPRASENFTVLAPGCAAVVLSVSEIKERANDAAGCVKEASDLLQSTTLGVTSSSQSYVSFLATLCSCVATVTASFIPELMPLNNSFDLGLIVHSSWLDIPGLSDSAKYRLLGNAVAVPVVEWIARRIVEVSR